LKEAAEFCQRLGATEALNLDGGSSSSLVFGGKMINTPRTDDEALPHGRAISTAIIFE
jgi:exopolysaccharide biosynthesis protein